MQTAARLMLCGGAGCGRATAALLRPWPIQHPPTAPASVHFAAAPPITCAPNNRRPLSYSAARLNKRGKANLSHARSDTTPVEQADGSRRQQQAPQGLPLPTPTDEAFDVSGVEAGILRAIERLTHALAELRAGGRLNPSALEGIRVQLGRVSQGKESIRLGDVAQLVPRGGRALMVMVGEHEVRATRSLPPFLSLCFFRSNQCEAMIPTALTCVSSTSSQ